MSSTRTGICPRCGGSDTDVSIKSSEVAGETVYWAWGTCHGCGFEDVKLRGHDPDMLAEIAGRAFMTVYVDGSGEEFDGMPTIDELADDVSLLIKVICDSHPDCYSCPMHNAACKALGPSDEGYVAQNSRLGLCCRDQDDSVCRSSLLKKYPALSGER